VTSNQPVKTPKLLIPTRQSLISRLKNWEDQCSWQDFFDTYGKLMHAVALQSGLTDAEAQEVVQETVIAVAKNIVEFKYDPAVGSFKGWLLHTTRWRIGDQFRKRQKAGVGANSGEKGSRRTATIDRIADPAGNDLEAIWDKEWKKNLFETALARVKRVVNAKHYQIFDLYVVNQWPAQKVAETLGISCGKVFLAKHRVSALVKREIRQLEKQPL
jgi:RNA polymerase sigma factor (sigma-70 family)